MEYLINTEVYASAFFLPTSVADEHLRMAGKANLKVLLWLFRNPGQPQEPAVISRQTGIPEDEIDDAMLYWVEAGILRRGGEAEKAPAAPKAQKPETAREAFHPAVKADNADDEVRPALRITPSQIAARLAESEDVAYLMNQAQAILGRTLGTDAQADLLEIHDFYGLDTRVILTACQYARTVGRQNNMKFIKSLTKGWSRDGVDDFEKASQRVAQLMQSDALWERLRAGTGIETPRPTEYQSECLFSWTQEMGFTLDMILLAYERTAEKKGKVDFRYMNGILQSWHRDGVKTPQDVEAAERAFAQRARGGEKPPAKGKTTKSSYDIDKAIERAKKLDPTKTKRGQ